MNRRDFFAISGVSLIDASGVDQKYKDLLAQVENFSLRVEDKLEAIVNDIRDRSQAYNRHFSVLTEGALHQSQRLDAMELRHTFIFLWLLTLTMITGMDFITSTISLIL